MQCQLTAIFLFFFVSALDAQAQICPTNCVCIRVETSFEVSCRHGGLNDWTLSKLIPRIPKDATIIRIEAPDNNPNNFSLTQDFVRFAKLRELHLVNCGLSSLGKRTFENIKTLKVLNLSKNKLEFMSPDTFASTDHLETLILSKNFFFRQKLPSGTFAHLRNLVSLDLSTNFISDFSTNLFSGLTNLRNLNLDDNKISPTSFDLLYDLPNLESLSLSNCQLSALPENSFRKNSKLRILNLSGNQLKSLVMDALKSIPNLISLNISRNFIPFVPKFALGTTPKLRILDLSSNFLGISSNHLTEANFLDVFHPNAFKNLSLEELFLSNNSFTFFDSGQLKLSSSLRYLDLSDNPLGQITSDQTRNLSQLRSLRLSNVRLDFLPNRLPMEYASLKYLDLSRNTVQSIPYQAITSSLKSLDHLDISSNRFTTLPDYVRKAMEKMSIVYLNDNPWDCHCQISGLRDFLLADKMRGKCDVMRYQDIMCSTPAPLSGRPVVLIDKPADCSKIFGASGLSRPGELGIVIAGVCGLLLLLGLITAVACSYFWPRATYHTNEEKANLSASSSEHSNVLPTSNTVERLF